MKIVDTNSGGAGGPPCVRVNRTGRRTYSRQYKLEIIKECSAPGVSVAGIALSHGINANLVRRWIVQHRSGRMLVVPSMLPVTVSMTRASTDMQPSAPAAVGVIEIELHGACVRVRGVVDAAALRTVLDALAQR